MLPSINRIETGQSWDSNPHTETGLREIIHLKVSCICKEVQCVSQNLFWYGECTQADGKHFHHLL
jgi:hypothetical protein